MVYLLKWRVTALVKNLRRNTLKSRPVIEKDALPGLLNLPIHFRMGIDGGNCRSLSFI